MQAHNSKMNIYSVYTCTCTTECRGFESHLRQLIFLGKVTALQLGVSVLIASPCCLFDLACFFLKFIPSQLSLTLGVHAQQGLQ